MAKIYHKALSKQ